MGLPQINIIFEGLANTIKFRSERGIVAIVINDDVAANNSSGNPPKSLALD